jgi:rubrerythrin
MEFVSLREIIDYAVQKEEEAMEFYQGLAAKVKHAAVAEELRKMAAVEQGHRDRLKNMDMSAGFTGGKPPKEDLKIADYLVDVEPGPNMSYRDVVQVAMKRELASMRLYNDLAKIIADSAARQLFEQLAGEESAHKQYFEKIWDDEVWKGW